MDFFDDFLLEANPFSHENEYLSMNQPALDHQSQLWNDDEQDHDSLLDSILTGSDFMSNHRLIDNGNVDNDLEISEEMLNVNSPDEVMLEDWNDGANFEIISNEMIKVDVGLSEDDLSSEDSGFDPRQIVSPSSVHNSDLDLQEGSRGSEMDRKPVVGAHRVQVMPVSNQSPVQRLCTTIWRGGNRATTLLLPVLSMKSGDNSTTILKQTKKRRVSNSSSDSGNSSIDMGTRYSDDVSTSKSPRLVKTVGKYPALILTEEEKHICERENIKLPTHYPLTREEEKNLKRIRRKIRNKVSAQDSRRRKREYMDDMEKRVKQCTVEKEELQIKLDQLETQNKTLAGQLRRLQQMIMNGGLRQNQTSTAMMVLLLSTAFFLLPGMKDQHESNNKDVASSQVDISRALKMPPMPGQSRSLLQINEEFNEAPNVEAPMTQTPNENKKAMNIKSSILIANKIPKDEKFDMSTNSFSLDHDYIGRQLSDKLDNNNNKKKRSYIVDDVPPEGYGYSNTNLTEDITDEIKMEAVEEEEVYFITDEEVIISDINDKIQMNKFYEEDRKLNVNVTTPGGSGVRTVILHVPKDIK